MPTLMSLVARYLYAVLPRFPDSRSWPGKGIYCFYVATSSPVFSQSLSDLLLEISAVVCICTYDIMHTKAKTLAARTSAKLLDIIQ